ncbi:iron-sulfur cluster biosynthesis [Bacillus sp. FJAT-27225]|uniref:iron-sulfur cluster biosynthesis n=1 Tax=Bacillus sp. FJAT-27225 TaxID=1743144 RepID=UPI00080C32C9|nr:iron-sulfur cluster biosynthesis [Bacillus sp. FJAT-27225]OCA88027.1 iron-sulfur cluster biosynthesis [Bacillus sp. FJAT-27225]
MFEVTEAAIEELQARLKASTVGRLVRLQMRKSCFMKVKVTVENAAAETDEIQTISVLDFIIDKGECHYFRNKKLDFIRDHTGFKQFEVL